MARVSITNLQAITLLGLDLFNSLKASGSIIVGHTILTRKSHDKSVCVIGEVEHIVDTLTWPVAGPALNEAGIKYAPPTTMEQAQKEELVGLERMKRNLLRV